MERFKVSQIVAILGFSLYYEGLGRSMQQNWCIDSANQHGSVRTHDRRPNLGDFRSKNGLPP